MTTFPFPVEAVIFDMDGLLLDTESVYRAAMIASALAMGYDFPDDFCQSMVGTAEAEIHHMLQQRFGADFPIARLFADCEAEMGRRLDAGVPVKAGAAELIGELAARKLPMAVATSTVRRIAEHHLQRAGLLDHFAAVCTREDVTRGKPHPDIFLAAAGKLRRAPRALHRVGGFRTPACAPHTHPARWRSWCRTCCRRPTNCGRCASRWPATCTRCARC